VKKIGLVNHFLDHETVNQNFSIKHNGKEEHGKDRHWKNKKKKRNKDASKSLS
jgi:hypothetical protein